jgi:outer membrane immunogenic protein
MKSLILAGVAVPALMFATFGLAADLPARRAPLYTPPPVIPVFTWTGFYAGVNGGYGFGSFKGRGPALPGDPDGGMIGGTAGYNYQIGNIVVGMEADLDYANVNNSSTFPGPLTTKSTSDFQDTIRGRVGYAVNRALIYATGGYAGGNLHTTVYDVPNNFYNAQSNYLNGYAIGAGVEYAIQPNISAKLEYMYTDLGKAYNFVGSPDVTRIGLTQSTVKAGVNYHF